MVNQDLITEIQGQIDLIAVELGAYTDDVGSKFAKGSILTCDGLPMPTPHSGVKSLIAQNEKYISNLNYTSKVKELDARESTTGKANAAYKQSEQSSMLYNLSVSALVNIISGILILIFFIGKELILSLEY